MAQMVQMDLTYFYPTRTRKTIKKIETYCSGSRRYYLKKHVVDEKDGWYHVMECIGRKKNTSTYKFKIRDIFRHYIIPYYDYMNDHAVSRLSGQAQRYHPDVNVTRLDKKYHVTTYQYK
jgi:hypothetical protein